MRESAAELRGKQELRIARDLFHPQLGDLGPERLIEGGVDFHRIEVARKHLSSAWKLRGVRSWNKRSHSNLRIRPTGRSAIERLGEGHDGTYILLFFAISISEEKAKIKWACERNIFLPCGNLCPH